MGFRNGWGMDGSCYFFCCFKVSDIRTCLNITSLNPLRDRDREIETESTQLRRVA